MNTISRFAVAMIALSVTVPAFAADLFIPTTPVASAPAPVIPVDEPTYVDNSYNWTGFYAGLVGGHAWGRTEHNRAGEFDANGYLLGGTIGYNFEIDDFVYGVEGDLVWTDTAGTFGTASTNIDWVGTLRARAGYDFNGILPYVTGGFALSEIKGVDTAVPYNTSEVQLGLTVGAGLEVGVTDAISVRAEYSYTDFGGDWDFNNGNGIRLEHRSHAVKTGLAVHF